MAERQGRVAVVTGAGTGIGRAISRSLAFGGWRVVLVGRRRDVLDALAAESDAMAAFDADVSDPAAVETLTAQIVERFARVDLLVANAGSGHPGPTDTLAEVAEHWMGTVARVVLPAVLIEQGLRPYLARPGGRVVVITSAAAKGGGGPAAYGAAKAALNRWVTAQASLLGPEGITVNAVAPGFVPDTELYGGAVDADWAAKIARGIAVGRPGTPEDIADAVCWLACPESGFVNGTVVEVDGGRVLI